MFLYQIGVAQVLSNFSNAQLDSANDDSLGDQKKTSYNQ